MAARAPHYPIRAVARLTGLSVDTLRAWERRYQAVTPVRGERGRAYTDSQIARLKQLALLTSQGHAIGTIAGLSDAALQKLQAAPAAKHAAAGEAADVSPLLAALKNYDLEAIESILNRHAVMLPADALVFGVVLPALREVGRQWEAGGVRPAQEHLVSAVIRSVLGGLLRTNRRPTTATKILFAAPAGERHELGLLCAAVLAATAGHAVIYLGPDLPPADIAHAATTAGAGIVILAATADAGLDAPALRRLARLPAGIAIWAGGRHARAVRATLGPRVRVVERLEDLPDLLARHAG